MKLLALDVETSPNVVYTWGLRDQNIGLNQILETSQVICLAAKWIGPEAKGGVHFWSVWEHGRDAMLRGIHALLDECDAVVHWNGTSFDMKHLNREFLEWGMSPPSPYGEIDLLKTSRRRFKFQSNKLEHVAQELLGYGKTEHQGFGLWLGAWRDNEPSAQKLMKKYNIQDVVLLDDLYNVLLPWIPNHPNVALYGTDAAVCPKCGSDHLQSRGYRTTAASRYRQFQCQSCGGWSRTASPEPLRIRPEQRPA